MRGNCLQEIALIYLCIVIGDDTKNDMVCVCLAVFYGLRKLRSRMQLIRNKFDMRRSFANVSVDTRSLSESREMRFRPRRSGSAVGGVWCIDADVDCNVWMLNVQLMQIRNGSILVRNEVE